MAENDVNNTGTGSVDEIVLTMEMGDATSARTAEAYAVGKRGGVDVPETDPAWHNNAKWYAEQAAGGGEEAEEAAERAEAAQAAAESAQAAAETAEGGAQTAQAGAEAAQAAAESARDIAAQNASAAASSASDAATAKTGAEAAQTAAAGSASAAADSASSAASSKSSATSSKNAAASSATAAAGSATAAAGSATEAAGSATAAAGSAAEAEAVKDYVDENYGQLSEDVSSLKTSLKHEHFGSYYDYKEIVPVWESGYIKPDGSAAAGSSYHRTNKIRIYPGQCIKASTLKGNGNLSLFSVFNTETGLFVKSVLNGSSSQPIRTISWQNNESNPVDVMLSTNIDQTTVVYVTAINASDEANWNNSQLVNPILFQYLSGYYNSSAEFTMNATEPMSNVVTTPCFFPKGSRIVVTTKGGGTTAQVLKSDKYGNPISVLIMNNGDYLTSNLVIDDDSYLVFGGNLALSEITVNAYRDIVKPAGINNFNLVMPTVAFVFDDGTVGDANVYNIFKQHNKTASFALVSTIVNDARAADYLKYQSDGFEILSHSTDGRTMNGYSGANIQDESVAVKCMLDSKIALLNFGFDIHGWVTPSGRLNPAWVKDVKSYYDYGFVLTNLSYTDESVIPYYNRNVSAFATYRVSLQSSTPEMWRQAVELAIANNGMVVFYGHNVQDTSEDNLTKSSLDSFLTYLDAKSDDVQVLPCNTAMKYFFKVTHEDYIT